MVSMKNENLPVGQNITAAFLQLYLLKLSCEFIVTRLSYKRTKMGAF